jgi:imidazolonepropionase-like amidohydrolase
MRSIKPSLSFLCLLLAGHWSFSQSDVPAPAPKQSQSIYLTHATIHVGDGKVLQNATIAFADGRIILVEENPSFKTDETMGRVIDCTGKHIYPGIIAPNTRIGLAEIEAVRATNDYAEVGTYNADVRAIVSYNTDSRVTPTVRSNGVLYAQTVPLGGAISGTSALVQLDAWNWEDALVKEDGIWLTWPSMVRRAGSETEPESVKINKDYEKQTNAIKDYFREAKSYLDIGRHEKANVRFDALEGLFGGKKKLFVRVNRAEEILQAVQLAQEFKLQMVIAGGTESWMVADELVRRQIPVMLSETHDLPVSDDADIDQPFKTPALLQKAGVLFCLSIPNGFWQERNLMFMAGTAVNYGLTKEQALASITSSTAKILGVDDRIGTLAKGKAASLTVSEGDILDMKKSAINYAFIDGRSIDLNNKQKELNLKFSQKYGLK